MKKIILIISLILFLGGCYNYKELNDYAIATGMAIDYSNKEYELSFLIPNSSKESEQNGSYTNVVYSSKGKTIYDALKKIGLIVPKEIYVGHLSIVVVSEDAAKKSILSALDFLFEEPRSKKNFYIALSKGSKAKDILAITTPLSDFPSQALANNLKSTQGLQSSILVTDFNTLMYKIINDGVDPVLTGFSIKGKEKDGTNQEQKTSVPKTYTTLNTLGIFKKDKFIKWATKNESRGINIINNKANELYVTTKCESGYLNIYTEDIKTNLKLKKNGNVDLDVKGTAVINEITCDIDLNDQKNIDKIEKQIEKKIKSYLQESINTFKETKSDYFGLGLLYYHKYPKQYEKIKDWDKFYENMKFKIKVNIDIDHTGSLQQSIKEIDNEKNN